MTRAHGVDIDALDRLLLADTPTVTITWDQLHGMIRRLRAAEAALDPCLRDSCGHARADHDGGNCGAGVEGEMGWIRCGCSEFVDDAQKGREEG